jgi:hypothetical protein
MFDLIGEGLRSQQQALVVNRATYTRIVRGDELLADVHDEAETWSCSVWADPKLRKTVICLNRPNENYIRVHVKRGRVHQVFGAKEPA